MMFIVLAVLGVLVYWFVFRKGNRNTTGYEVKTPDEILNERFANGEIDEMTYRNMKEQLRR